MRVGDEGDFGEQVGREAGRPYSVDARGGLGVQVGEGNTQIIYAYSRGTWTDGVAPPPLASVSGAVESPYRGLAAFGEGDAPFFFGREEATNQILQRMSRAMEGQGLLVVSGASGAGKSSLLRAGLLPRLRGAGLPQAPGAASWPGLVMTPGRAPLGELAVRVALLSGADAWAMRRALAGDPAAFALAARQAVLARSPALGGPAAPGLSGQRLLLVVDQFEQLFTQCADQAERQAFISCLCAASGRWDRPGAEPAALVILGVRADFEARCAAYPELAVAVQDRYLVTAMTERQLRMAITGPARAVRTQADDALTATLLAEVRVRQPGGSGAGVLPLLSHALDQAWRTRAGQALTLADYERTGGIEGAVAASAERAYGRLTSGRREAARQVFTRLVATGPDGTDTADRATRAELVEGKDPAQMADVEAVLEAFAAERLLTLAADSVEISHEALLTAWPLLRDSWLAESHADRIVRTRLRGAAGEWERRSGDPAYLYRGTLLQAAVETTGKAPSDPGGSPPLSRLERSFLRASDNARRRAARLRQAVLVVVVVLALVAAGFAVLFNQQRATASQQRDQAVESQIVAQAGELNATNPSLAAQLLLAAYQKGQTPENASRLFSTENQPLSVAKSAGSNVHEVLFSPDRKTLAIQTTASTVVLWDVSHPGQPSQLGQPITTAKDDPVASMAFSRPDGSILAIGDAKGNVILRDLSHPGQPGQPLTTGDGQPVYAMAFSPDGKTLLAAGTGGVLSMWKLGNTADRPFYPALQRRRAFRCGFQPRRQDPGRHRYLGCSRSVEDRRRGRAGPDQHRRLSRRIQPRRKDPGH